jgi:hypothetical protein
MIYEFHKLSTYKGYEINRHRRAPHLATRNGHVATVRKLLNGGAEANELEKEIEEFRSAWG